MSVPSAHAPAAKTDRPTHPITGIARTGIVLTYLACLATPWNGLSVGLRPGDMFILLALMVLAAAGLGSVFPRLPGWTWLFVGTILFITVLHELLPTDARYLSTRLIVDARGFPIPEVNTNAFVGAKFIVGVLGLSLIVSMAAQYDRRNLKRCAIAFALGSGISAFAGFADLYGAHIGLGAGGGRANGFAVQPNFLGETSVLSLPFAMWLLTCERTRDRVLGGVLLAVLALGEYASGSRGGSVAFVVTLAVCAVVMPTYRRYLPGLALLGALVGAALFVAIPSLGQSLLHALRLSGSGTTAAGSDLVRSQVGQQGIKDFQHSPIDGIGMQVAAEAHNVYLQAMATGGLIMLGAFLFYLLGAALTAVRLIPFDDLARPLVACVLSIGLLNFVENSFSDRLVYVPIALIAGMQCIRWESEGHASAREDRPDRLRGRGGLDRREHAR